jgi:TPR repeat protein
LGKCYRRGVGVQKDSKMAHFWLKRASAQGHSGARALLGGR